MIKRVFALLFACLFLFSSALAEGIDYSSMSDEDLQTTISMARNELEKRGCMLSEDTVFLNCETCKVYRDGAKEIYLKNDLLHIPVILISDAAEEISFQLDSVQINGWDCSGIIGNVSAAGKKRDEITVNCTGAAVSSLEEIEDITLVVIAFNMGTFQRDGEGEPMTLIING